MSAFAWPRRPGHPSSPPESSSSAGRRSTVRRPASSNSFDPSSRHGGLAACARSATGRLRPVLAAALLSLPLLAGLPNEASAQTAPECTTANSDGAYPVPDDWALKPAGVTGKFRLLFVTSTTRDATATAIATYNTFVQTRIKAGHSAISDSCGNLFKVVGSTSSVDARDNTGTTGTGVRIHWLNGNKLADNYADFYDNTWDDYTNKNEHGNTVSAGDVWTGSISNGTKHSTAYLGASIVMSGLPDGVDSPLESSQGSASDAFHFYGLSPVFEVTPPDAVFYIHPVKSDGTPELDGQRVTVSEDDGKLVFRIQHARSPERENGVGHDIEFNYCVIDDRQSSPGWHVRTGCGNNKATLPANTAYIDVEIPVRANTEGPLGNNGAEVTLMAGTGYITLNTSAFYTIQDGTDTEPARQSHTVKIESTDENKEWTEGEDVRFAIRLNRPAQVPFDVHLKVEESGGGDFVSAASEGHKTVRFKYGQSWYFYRVPTVKDAGNRQPQSVVTVSLTDTGGNVPSGLRTTVVPGGRGVYVISKERQNNFSGETISNGPYLSPFKASSTVVDADPLREMSFETVSQEVQEDAGIVNLKVNFLPAPVRPIGLRFALEGSATLHQDYSVFASLLGDNRRTGWLRVWANRSSVTIPIRIRDDHISDDRETIVVRLLKSGRHVPAASGGAVTLTIRNHDPGPDARPAGSLPADHPLVTYGFLVSDIRDSYILDHDDDGVHTRRWKRVLKALGDPDYADYPRAAMTAAEATTLYQTHGWNRWSVTSAALAYAEAYFSGTTTPPPASGPEVTIAAGSGVTEGTAATFTLTADPAPAAALDVSVTVAVDGDYGIAAGTQTVTIPTTGSATLTLATTGDEADEADGSVSVTVDDGTGYTVGSDSSGSVAIADDDDPPATAAVDPALLADVRSYAAETGRGPVHVGRWNRVLFALTGGAEGAGPAMTAAEAKTYADRGWTRWDPVVAALETLENAAPDTTDTPAQTPEVTIAAGDGVTEGGSATFTLTADPAPSAPLDVSVTVATDGDYGIAAGERTVTIPTTGSYTLSLATAGDETDEADGSVSVTVDAGTGYTVGDASSGTVAIADDDSPPASVPEVTITAGSGVTEGTAASFTLAADPAPSAALDVTVTVAADGDYGITAGTQTVTIPTTGSYTLTLATTGDEVDEADGSVSVTVDAGTGYTIGTASSGTVAIADDDLPPPVVTIAAGAGVTEGTAATFTLSANPAPASPLDVTVTVAASGDYGIAAGQRTVTIPTAGSYVLTLATTGDEADEADGSVSVTVDDGTGYTVGAASFGTVAIADDDLPPPQLSVTAGAGVTEGGDAVFTVKADRAVDADLAVTLTVSEKAGSDFVAAADEGAKTVTILDGETEAMLTVKTEDDAADEPDGSVSATVAAGTGYTVAASPVNAASVAVADNDAAALGPPVISVEDVTVQEGEVAVVPVTLSPAPTKPVRLFYRSRFAPNSAGKRADLNDFKLTRAWLSFRPGETLKYARVQTKQDSHDDGGEVFEVMVVSAGGGAVPTYVVATVTIENADPLPAAYLARFGRTVAEQALDGIAGRMAEPRTPGMQSTLAGQVLSPSTILSDPESLSKDGASGQAFDPVASGPSMMGSALPAMAGIAQGLGSGVTTWAGPGGEGEPLGGRLGTPPLQAYSMTAREALLGSRFTLTGEADGAGGSFAFWGRAMQGRFDGVERGDETDLRLDGEVTTALLGGDYARGRWLAGVALLQSLGEGGYTGEGVGEMSGAVESRLTAAVPYVSLQASQRLRLWAALGYGTGEVTLDTGMGERLEAGTDWQMAALGMRGDVLAASEGGGPGLALTSDALWTRTQSDEVQGLSSSSGAVTRLRLGLEGSWEVSLSGLGTLTPKLEMGLRHDGGDVETGFGVELGGGIAWLSPGYGLSLLLEGRALVAHETDLEDSGVSVALSFDPSPASARGPSVSLRQTAGGQAAGGVAALFGPQALARRTGTGEMGGLLSAEAAWGFAALGGRFTGSPHISYALSDMARDYTLGWRLEPVASEVSLGVSASQRDYDDRETEHVVGLEVRAGW